MASYQHSIPRVDGDAAGRVRGRPTRPGAPLAGRSAPRPCSGRPELAEGRRPGKLLAVSRFPDLCVGLALFALDRPHALRPGNRATRLSLSLQSRTACFEGPSRAASRPGWPLPAAASATRRPRAVAGHWQRASVRLRATGSAPACGCGPLAACQRDHLHFVLLTSYFVLLTSPRLRAPPAARASSRSPAATPGRAAGAAGRRRTPPSPSPPSGRRRRRWSSPTWRSA